MSKAAEKLSQSQEFHEAAVQPIRPSAAKSEKREKDESGNDKPVVIKKYANRRLYNTETSSYVTLEDLGEMVRSERDFHVYDAKTGEDLTHAVLTQIIVEEEGRTGSNLLPIGFLRQLIRFYGHSIEQLVPKYLEFSMETLTREQERYRKQFTSTFGAATFEAMQEQARQNMALFERAFSMFAPLVKPEEPEAPARPVQPKPAAPAPAAAAPVELAELKAQLSAVQAQLERLSKGQEAK
jgi:polyhydroxyalkanoate synthesis repressor PhaR